MKRETKLQKKSLRVQGETLRTLTMSEVQDIVGASNNGCGTSSLTIGVTVCHICSL